MRTDAYLVVLGRELVQALLNDVIPIEVLDEHDNVQTKRDDYGMDL